MAVKKLGVRNKKNDGDGLFLVKPRFDKCKHYQSSFEIDADAGKCFCRQCGDEVSPMFVLSQLMKNESQWMQSRDRYQNEMKRLAKRLMTKCQHCKKFTRISGK